MKISVFAKIFATIFAKMLIFANWGPGKSAPSGVLNPESELITPQNRDHGG